MNLKVNPNGKVTFLMRTGKDFVQNEMAASSAQYIIDHGEKTESPVPAYPIGVNDQYFFAEEEVKKATHRNIIHTDEEGE